MTVSVVIPAFNAAATIGEQLEALAQQVEGIDAEVIVADNGSTDETRVVARSFGNRLPLRIVDASSRRGPAAARNAGAKAATRDLVVFTDADDVVIEGWLDAWVHLDPALRFATGPVRALANHEDVPKSTAGMAEGPPIHLGFLPYAFGTNFAVRRDALLAIGGFPENRRTAEDVTLSWELQLSGVPLSFVPAAGVAVRRAASTFVTLRRYYHYGWSDPFLVREFRDEGLRVPPFGRTLKSYIGILARLPLIADERQRHRWAAQAGRRAGRLVGSVRAGVLCP
jgi:glycosyltransferase involved in cell wall biosynthesis